MTRTEQLFLRPYGDSHGADHYAQYWRSVSEAPWGILTGNDPERFKKVRSE